jgi:hypothetical protein
MKELTPLNESYDMEDENRDMFDGRSIVGCLFLGIFLMAGIIIGLGVLITKLR